MSVTIIFALWAGLQGQRQISGRVTSTAGAPIAGAIVAVSRSDGAETDASGLYSITMKQEHRPGRVLLAYADGYESAVKPLSTNDLEADVQLKGATPAWEVPGCAALSEPHSLVAVRMRFAVAKEQKVVTTPTDVDYHREIVPFRSQHRKFGLVLWIGPFVSLGRPSYDLFATSTSLEERPWRSGALVGLDVRGVATDGSRWHWLGPRSLGEAAVYEGVTDSAAGFFDAILDSMCVESPAGHLSSGRQ